VVSLNQESLCIYAGECQIGHKLISPSLPLLVAVYFSLRQVCDFHFIGRVQTIPLPLERGGFFLWEEFYDAVSSITPGCEPRATITKPARGFS